MGILNKSILLYVLIRSAIFNRMRHDFTLTRMLSVFRCLSRSVSLTLHSFSCLTPFGEEKILQSNTVCCHSRHDADVPFSFALNIFFVGFSEIDLDHLQNLQMTNGSNHFEAHASAYIVEIFSYYNLIITRVGLLTFFGAFHVGCRGFMNAAFMLNPYNKQMNFLFVLISGRKTFYEISLEEEVMFPNLN